jgi:hypothetical protein
LVTFDLGVLANQSSSDRYMQKAKLALAILVSQDKLLVQGKLKELERGWTKDAGKFAALKTAYESLEQVWSKCRAKLNDDHFALVLTKKSSSQATSTVQKRCVSKPVSSGSSVFFFLFVKFGVKGTCVENRREC